MRQQETKDLLKKYLSGNCTEAEKGLVETWYLQHEIKELPQISEELKKKQLDEIFRSLPIQHDAKRIISLWPRLAVAGMVLIGLGLSIYLYQHRQPEQLAIAKSEVVDDLKSGEDKAVLTLSDGRRIALDETDSGDITNEAGVIVTKTKDGQLLYEETATASADIPSPLNTITTPKGGQYQVRLPDGSNVWLNAASSLRYPLRFSKMERQVELTGEAYFEIAHHPSIPFKVKTATQEVEVLGTHFNVNAYADEASVKTTLLEGSVKVTQTQTHVSKLLKPGQQAIVTNAISVRHVDTEQFVAWKDNLFMFNEDKLEHIMVMVGRWYNVDVVFIDSELRKELYSGSISKFVHVSQVLKKLELLGDVHFTLTDRTIKVTRK